MHSQWAWVSRNAIGQGRSSLGWASGQMCWFFFQGQLSVRTRTVFIQPQRVVMYVIVCVHNKNCKHWQWYHCLDTQEYSTPTVNPEGQKMAAHMAGEFKTAKDSSCLQKKHRHATAIEKRNAEEEESHTHKSSLCCDTCTILSDAMEVRECL